MIRCLGEVFMTRCNRCGNEFENFFNGIHWCTVCGKQFMFDENVLKEESKKSKKEED